MFLPFFYLLRERGVKVSLNEWMVLMEGLDKDLHGSSLLGFYYLCRAVLIKSEVDYDRFDEVFLEFFSQAPVIGDLPDKVQEWMNTPVPTGGLERDMEELKTRGMEKESIRQLQEMLEERVKQKMGTGQAGNRRLGSHGHSPFGHGGWHPGGFRIGGEGMNMTASMVAGERKFRDFRKDNVLDIRQFQVALRTLRQLSAQMSPDELEFDIDQTIHDTCDKGGILQIRMKPPRKNNIKVLLLMDSGGSMEYFANLCSMLFQAVTKINHFKELKIYYFHNCIHDDVFEEPKLEGDPIPTEWILKNYDETYKVIFVGDADMDPNELRERPYHWGPGTYTPSCLDWLERFKKQYPYIIWLNPKPMPAEPSYWDQTHWQIGHMFDMFQLTAEGIEKGMKRLMVRK